MRDDAKPFKRVVWVHAWEWVDGGERTGKSFDWFTDPGAAQRSFNSADGDPDRADFLFSYQKELDGREHSRGFLTVSEAEGERDRLQAEGYDAWMSGGNFAGIAVFWNDTDPEAIAGEIRGQLDDLCSAAKVRIVGSNVPDATDVGNRPAGPR